MKTYLLEITRGTRAERPLESQLLIDSPNATLGNVAGVSQSSSADNYFILDNSMDLQQNVDRILSTMHNNPFSIGAGHGWRCIEYPFSHKWTKDYTQKSRTYTELDMDDPDSPGEEITVYADVWIRKLTEDSSETVTYTGEGAMAQAIQDASELEQLDPSDGWVMGQEWEGKTIVVDSRPSLWMEEEEVPIRGSKTNPMLGRSDTDRY